jgi:putative oxidoreductase
MLSLQGATRYELSASELLGEVKMNENFIAAYRPQLLSLFRFITGLLLLQYGIAKIFKFPVLPYFANIPPLITAAGAIELVGGALLLLGLFTRPVAFILAGEMAFAYFLGHMFKVPDAPVFLPLNNGGTAAILFCFACLYLATAGGGPYSLDAIVRKKS